MIKIFKIGDKVKDGKGNEYKILDTGNGFNNHLLGLARCTYRVEVTKYDRRHEMVGHVLETVSSETMQEACEVIK